MKAVKTRISEQPSLLLEDWLKNHSRELAKQHRRACRGDYSTTIQRRSPLLVRVEALQRWLDDYPRRMGIDTRTENSTNPPKRKRKP